MRDGWAVTMTPKEAEETLCSVRLKMYRLAGYVRERATWRSLEENKKSTRWLKVVAEREAAEHPLTYSPLTAYNERYACHRS